MTSISIHRVKKIKARAVELENTYSSYLGIIVTDDEGVETEIVLFGEPGQFTDIAAKLECPVEEVTS